MKTLKLNSYGILHLVALAAIAIAAYHGLVGLDAVMGLALMGTTSTISDIEGKLADLRDTESGIRGMIAQRQNQLDSMIGRIAAQGRDATPSESTRMSSLEAIQTASAQELEQVLREIHALEGEVTNLTPMPRRTQPAPIYNGPYSSVPALPVSHIGGAAPGGRLFNQMFPTNRRAVDPYAGRFSDLGEFARAVVNGHDSRLIRNSLQTYMGGDTGTDGGFLVPQQWVGEVFDEAISMEIVRPLATVLPMVGKDLIVGDFNYQDGTGGARAGLQLQWGQPEGQELFKQKGKAKEFHLSARKASIFVVVSNELAGDAPNFDRQLRSAMAKAVAAGLDGAFLAGTGAGQPQGIINAAAKISVAKESSQVAATIVLANLAKMLGRLTPASFRRAKWLVHPTCLPQLYMQTVTIKNVAASENVGGGSAGVVQNTDGSLSIFGIPVLVSEWCKPVGTEGDIILADLSRYVIGMRQDMVIAKSEHQYFAEDALAFRLIMRLDGQPEPHSVFTLADGTNTVSPIVTLATRA